MADISSWPLIGRRWRERECITCYLIPGWRIFDRLHAWHMARLDDDLPGPSVRQQILEGLEAAKRGETVYLGDFTQYADDPDEDDDWADELHAMNQATYVHPLLERSRTRSVADLTFYEVEAVIRQLRIPDWLPERAAA